MRLSTVPFGIRILISALFAVYFSFVCSAYRSLFGTKETQDRDLGGFGGSMGLGGFGGSLGGILGSGLVMGSRVNGDGFVTLSRVNGNGLVTLSRVDGDGLAIDS